MVVFRVCENVFGYWNFFVFEVLNYKFIEIVCLRLFSDMLLMERLFDLRKNNKLFVLNIIIRDGKGI